MREQIQNQKKPIKIKHTNKTNKTNITKREKTQNEIIEKVKQNTRIT